MSHPTRLLVLTAALMLAASSAHAFTFGDQTTTNSNSAPTRSYGGTLTDPGSQIRTYDGVDLTTPKTSTTTPTEGFSFRFGSSSGPFGSGSSQRLAPPKWSTDPLYLEKGE
jgi:hypothetical protein